MNSKRSRLWLPYPEDKSTKKRLSFWMEVFRTIGAFATLFTCLANLILFSYQVNVLKYESNRIEQIGE